MRNEMSPSARPEQHINLNYPPQLASGQSRSGSSTAATSPTEPPPANSLKSPFGTMTPINANSPAASRGSAGSPSHEFGSGRLYSKRAREIQAQEGVGSQVWGPPTSGNSTPLRETIPESPTSDSFPDFNQGTPEQPASLPLRPGRTRAGTLPSRFSPAATLNNLIMPPSLAPKTARPTPSTSPFKPASHAPTEPGFPPSLSTAETQKIRLARLRAGSLPQRAGLLPMLPPTNSHFGTTLRSTLWAANRERSSTLASIRSSDGPDSPALSNFSRDSLVDGDVKTLDYLGLVDTPKQARAQFAPSAIEMLLEQQRAGVDPASLIRNANRFRSYSVNATEKLADDEAAAFAEMYGGYSGQMTPAVAADMPAAIREFKENFTRYSLELQAYNNFATAMRPRAQTASVLDAPPSAMRAGFAPMSSRLDSTLSAADLSEDPEYPGLTEAVRGLHLGGMSGLGDDNLGDLSPTRTLWLGNIPTSTTKSSLEMIFNSFGTLESTRVLTHKNYGFVNFEKLENAVAARSQLNNKEIFPGAGPIRINFGKPPSNSGTPGHNGLYPSPSPDPLSRGVQGEGEPQALAGASPGKQNGVLAEADVLPPTPALVDIKGDIIDIVKELGATDEEQARITHIVEAAVRFDDYRSEIDPIPEASHNRIHDAPKLREIRKRIDNGTYPAAEIETVAMDMLPEIAELSSDYLGNTVVQKLFEFCDENVKEAMLAEIAPHLAEIGVHKNGTWAAQKIIDVARSAKLQTMVVNALRPYAVALFLDQFGNYVIQGCLRYSYPLNTFIFDAMLSRLWELAQGRFGARAMRACLESHYATKDQQRMVAAAIALHSVQLATNANGALLLTWFLDTCTFPKRRSVLAPRLVPRLVQLCTHKVAYLTVLKIINQRNEPEARDTILQALFFSDGDKILTEILSDQVCGTTLIFKVLTTPFFDEKIRAEVVANVRNVLLKIKAQPQQGYKRLMDEVGLSTRGGIGGSGRDQSRDPSEPRPMSKQGHGVNGHLPQAHIDTNVSRYHYGGAASAGGFDPTAGMQRTNSMDSSSTFDAYPGMNMMNGMSPMAFTPSPTSGAGPGMAMPFPSMAAQQTQYHQALMAQATVAAQQQQQQGQRGGFYAVQQLGMSGMPQMNGFQTGLAQQLQQQQQMDAYRTMSAASPMAAVGAGGMMGQQQPGAGAYGQMMAGGMIGGYAMAGMPQGQQMPAQYGYMGMQQQAQQAQQAGGMRRGRQR